MCQNFKNGPSKTISWHHIHVCAQWPLQLHFMCQTITDSPQKAVSKFSICITEYELQDVNFQVLLALMDIRIEMATNSI